MMCGISYAYFPKLLKICSIVCFFIFTEPYVISLTHTLRQATQHDCLPSLLGDKDKEIEIVYGEEKIYFVLGRLEQPRQNKKLL